MTRACQLLLETKLFQAHKDGRKIYLTYKESKSNLFEQMKPCLRNPVRKKGYIFKSELLQKMTKAGMSALSEVSFLSSPVMPIYAIEKSQAKTLSLLEEQLDSQNQVEIEIWDYDPLTLSGDGKTIDPLSLATSLLDLQDERVEMEIEKMLEETVFGSEE